MKVYCILSDERAYRSRSPTIFTTVLKRAGIRGAYVPFMVAPEDLGQAIESLRILNIAGANVTVPYKESVIPYLDVLSEGANIIGAINTIVCSEEMLKGYNTNAIGFMDALQHANFEVGGCRALVFGTGGAAKAVVFILNWLRAEEVYVAGRHAGRTSAIVEQFGGEATPLERLAGEAIGADILVNATSASSPDEAPKLAELVAQLNVPGCRLALDLNYGREENFWQEWATRRSIDFMDGLLPLAYQARRTFALWTGMQVPPEEFIGAL